MSWSMLFMTTKLVQFLHTKLHAQMHIIIIKDADRVLDVR